MDKERRSRGGRPDRRDGRQRHGRRDEGQGGGAYRIVAELSALEKPLSKGDLAAQKGPLEAILKALRPLKLRSIDELDLGTRGRLITSLLRVSRQAKPGAPRQAKPRVQAAEEPGAQAEGQPEGASPPAQLEVEATTGEAKAAEGAAPQVEPTPAPEPAAATPPAESGQPQDESRPASPELAAETLPADVAGATKEARPESPVAGEGAAPAEEAPAAAPTAAAESAGEPAGPAGAAPAEEAPAAAPTAAAESAGEPAGPAGAPAPSAPPAQVDEKAVAYQEVMYLVGSIWRAVGDERRAALALAASGRSADRVEAVKTLERTGDWREQASVLEASGKTRDAARIHERNKSFSDAARLFEAGGDHRSSLRAALAGRDNETARRLLKSLKPAEARPILEKADAWELLMEHCVEAQDFDGVAQLYERAKQFDQAALAWERAGKLRQARKAFERAGDQAAAARVQGLEVKKLIERGDRLSAAVLLAGAGERAKAVEVLMFLPHGKAFRFMQKAKLDEEALSLAHREIAIAEEQKRPGEKARWLELLGDFAAAAEAWLAAERKDRALGMFEQAGSWQRAAECAEAVGQYDKAVELFHRAGDKLNAERVAALPKPAPSAPPAAPPPAEAEPDVTRGPAVPEG